MVTASGVDVDSFEWSPDGERLAVMARLLTKDPETSQIGLVDLATGKTDVIAGEHSLDTAARWLPDGSILYVSDADGWFQGAVRRGRAASTISPCAERPIPRSGREPHAAAQCHRDARACRGAPSTVALKVPGSSASSTRAPSSVGITRVTVARSGPPGSSATCEGRVNSNSPPSSQRSSPS